MVIGGTGFAHQCVGAKGGVLGLSGFQNPFGGKPDISPHGHQNSDVLHKQTMGSSLLSPMSEGSEFVGLLYNPFFSPRSILTARIAE